MTDTMSLPNFSRLQDALAILSTALGNGSSAQAIMHGFPVTTGHIDVIYVQEAAAQAGLSLVSTDVATLKPYHCPLLFCNPAGQAIIIAELTEKNRGLALSDKGQTHDISTLNLAKAGFNKCWIVKPAEKHDARLDHGIADWKSHWLIESLWMDKSIVSGVVIATIFTNILALATPLIMMNVMDRVVSHAAFATLWALALGGMIAITLDFVLRTLRATLIDKAGAAGDVIVNNRIFAKILGTKISARQGSVGVQSNTLREFDSLREMSNAATVATMGDLPFTLLFLVVIAMVSGWLVVVPLLMIPVIILCGLLTQNKLNRLVAEHYKDMAHKNAVAVEVLSNMETIKAHVGESWAAAKWEKTVASYLRHSLDIRWWMALSSHMLLSLQSLTTILLLVVGVYFISAGNMSAGALFAAILLTSRALTPVTQIAGLLTKFHHAKTAYKSLRYLVDAEQERPEQVHFLKTNGPFRTLVLDHVSVSYGKQAEPAIKNLTLEINAGEKVGIIGAIGSGKSTLLRLLSGLRLPDSGVMLVDGMPIQQLDPAIYRRRIGTAFREEGFFFGTIRENLCFHRPEITDEELVNAARLGGALNWIKAQPAAFDTPIGEGGTGLSTGQKQTLALSRAFLGKPEILMFDEPTSDLDTRSELQFVTRLSLLQTDQTLIAVTHRPAVIEACTRLIVVDDGAVIMDGSKEMVLNQLRNAVDSERATKAA